jgi:prolyl-tRNA editing enzyme YbaK/EbsC (Cys-tRNA(Pro) deacylase)
MSNSQSPGSQTERLSELKSLLNAAGIAYAILEHEQTISTAQEGAQTGLGSLSSMAPTFILKTEAGYLAAIIRGDTRLAYKKIKRQLGLKNISLASVDQVKEVTGAEAGYVSLVNPGIETIIDEKVIAMDVVYGGCAVPRFTLRIQPKDLVAIVRARVFDFTEPKTS